MLITYLFRSVTWPHWTEHSLRTSLTVVGISLGVATVIGMANVSRSVLASFQHMVQTVAGASDLEITNATGRVDETLVGRVAEMPGVELAAGLNESTVTLPDSPGESLHLLGLDFLGSPIWKGQIPRNAVNIPDEARFVAEPDSVVLTSRFMRRAQLSLDDPVRVLVPGGVRTLRVRGELGETPITALFDGMVAVMDLPAAQRLLGIEEQVDRIAIQVAADVELPEVRARLTAALGPGVQVGAAETRGQEVERLLFSLRAMLICASSFAVMVGAFIVYHTVAVSVQQRRRQFALLNTIGVHRRSLVVLCLVETFILSLFGVLLGFVSGEALSALAAGVVGDTASEIWVQLRVDQQARSLPGVFAGASVGTATALLAAYVAVRATFRTPTVEALRPVSVEVEPLRGAGWLLLLGLALPAASWLIVLVPQGTGFDPLVGCIIATHAMAYAAGAVLGPPLVLLLGGGMRRLTRRSRSLPARLAADNMPRSPWRSGATVATISAALGMAVTLASVVHSFERAWLAWVEQHFGAHLFVGGGTQFRLLAGPPMDEGVRRLIEGTAGVANVEPFRVLPIRLGDRPVFLQGISLRDRLAHGGLPMVEGDFEAAVARLRKGDGVLVSDNLALRLGLHRGDTLEVPTPEGNRRFAVAGTFVDYLGSLDLGAVAVSRHQLKSVWHDSQANLFRVWLEPGASPSAARAAVLTRLGGGGYYVITAGEFLESVRDVLGRFFLATWGLQLVAALVGVIGVVNAQLASVLDRGREIAMIRTIGVPARQIVRAVMLECGALGLLGGLGGALIGSVLGSQFIGGALPLITGWRMPFELPLAPVATAVLVAMVVSATAGYVPARAAAAMQVRQRSLD